MHEKSGQFDIANRQCEKISQDSLANKKAKASLVAHILAYLAHPVDNLIYHMPIARAQRATPSTRDSL